MLDIAFPGVELFHLGIIDVDSQDAEAFLDKADDQRQPHITQADNSNHRGFAIQFPNKLFLIGHERLLIQC